MRKLEEQLVRRSVVALIVILVLTTLSLVATLYSRVDIVMCHYDWGFRAKFMLVNWSMLAGVMLMGFAAVAVWIGKIVMRYVDERDRLHVAKDMELASSIQLGSMPQTFPPYPERKSIDVYATIRPAKEVGGDFYDFYFAGHDRFVFLVADVSGKGVPAALFMMRAKSLLKGFINTGVSIVEAVERTNATLCEGNAAGIFVTAWVAELNTRTGLVTYVNAGHNRPLLRRPSSRLAEYIEDEPCLFLGSLNFVSYTAYELQLQPGDSLYLYTDGITEQVNPKMELFGEERLLNVVRGTMARQKNLLKYVSSCVIQHAATAEQTDDCTQLEVVWRGAPDAVTHDYAPTQEGIAQAAADLEKALDDIEMTFDVKMTVLTAADEICMNIIRHSGAKVWSLTVEHARFPSELRLVFEDDGKPFDPTMFRDPDTSIAIEDRQVGGLGIFIVKKTMSPVTYARRDGRNVLTLGKMIETPAKAPVVPVAKSLSERNVRTA